MVMALDLVYGAAEFSIETVSPTDLPPVGGKVVPLAGLAPLRCVIPQGNGAGDAARAPILKAARRLGLDSAMMVTDRWLTVVINNQATRPRGWSWREELELLRALCAWEVRGEAITARTRMDQTQLRRRLIGAYIAARQPFRVEWLPSYYPIECRVTQDSNLWPPYALVQRNLLELGPAMVIETAAPGAMVIGSAIVRCAPNS
jgi:hypothetical protein